MVPETPAAARGECPPEGTQTQAPAAEVAGAGGVVGVVGVVVVGGVARGGKRVPAGCAGPCETPVSRGRAFTGGGDG
ncbi:MAG: hypothetical protein ACREMO_07965 [Gemmatimonadales bacterium]